VEKIIEEAKKEGRQPLRVEGKNMDRR